jgi:hypothetical protein
MPAGDTQRTVPPSDLASGVASDGVQGGGPPHPTYTAAEVDAAIEALQEPERLQHAQEVVTHAAPALQRILAEALHEGGWFGPVHNAEVELAASGSDEQERVRAVATLVAEQTRLGMFVGAAIGFELAHELRQVAARPADNHTPPEREAE